MSVVLTIVPSVGGGHAPSFQRRLALGGTFRAHYSRLFHLPGATRTDRTAMALETCLIRIPELRRKNGYQSTPKTTNEPLKKYIGEETVPVQVSSYLHKGFGCLQNKLT